MPNISYNPINPVQNVESLKCKVRVEDPYEEVTNHIYSHNLLSLLFSAHLNINLVAQRPHPLPVVSARQTNFWKWTSAFEQEIIFHKRWNIWNIFPKLKYQ